MDCFDTLCGKLSIVGSLEADERLEFAKDGSVAVVKGIGLWNRKLINVTAQSRQSTIAGLKSLIDLSNDLSSGLMRLPKIRTDTTTVGGTDNSNSLCVEANFEVDNESAPKFFSQCNKRDREKLLRLASALTAMCRGMNRLSTSTYSNDSDTCGLLLNLINFAQLIVTRIEKAFPQQSKTPVNS